MRSEARPGLPLVGRRLVGLTLIGGLCVLVAAIWWGVDTRDYDDTRRRMASPDASMLSGWTTIFDKGFIALRISASVSRKLR